MYKLEESGRFIDAYLSDRFSIRFTYILAFNSSRSSGGLFEVVTIRKKSYIIDGVNTIQTGTSYNSFKREIDKYGVHLDDEIRGIVEEKGLNFVKDSSGSRIVGLMRSPLGEFNKSLTDSIIKFLKESSEGDQISCSQLSITNLMRVINSKTGEVLIAASYKRKDKNDNTVADDRKIAMLISESGTVLLGWRSERAKDIVNAYNERMIMFR